MYLAVKSLSLLSLLATLLAPLCLLAGEPNTLTAEEQAAGWKLLFDGKTVAGWVTISSGEPPAKGWEVIEGALARKSTGGDLISTEKFARFELTWEWKMAKENGNSGVKYNLPDATKPLGCEYQLLGKTDRTGEKHETASLYDLIAPATDTVVNPPGEWNSGRVLFDTHKAEHWINGRKAVEYEPGSEALAALIQTSHFRKVEGFGKPTESPILLQDHGGEVYFRSIKIRPLPATP